MDVDIANNAALNALATNRTRPHASTLIRTTPQCSHPVPRETAPNGFPSIETLARDAEKRRRRGLDPNLCASRSCYEIDGKPYCRIHADVVALEKLIEAAIAIPLIEDH